MKKLFFLLFRQKQKPYDRNQEKPKFVPKNMKNQKDMDKMEIAEGVSGLAELSADFKKLN